MGAQPDAVAPAKRARILVVDDEEAIRVLLKETLTRHNYEIFLAADGHAALDAAVDQRPNLVILDLEMPGLSGLEVCRELRTWLTAPILILSGRQEEAVEIAALDSGADDYLTKPFATGELLARIRALLRRGQGSLDAVTFIYVGGLEIDLARRRVSRAGQHIQLTRTEFDILALLAQKPDCVHTSEAILETVLGPQASSDPQTLRVHIAHLRRKIEPVPSSPIYIRTEAGVGYYLSFPKPRSVGHSA